MGFEAVIGGKKDKEGDLESRVSSKQIPAFALFNQASSSMPFSAWHNRLTVDFLPSKPGQRSDLQ